MNTIHTPEHEHTMFGVTGRMHNRVLDTTTGVFRNQKFIATKYGNGEAALFTVEVRFDDECNNGHQSFSITGHVGNMGGCIHEEIAKHFPELAHLIKWHLVSTDGPMHYVANTTYHASNRDHNGKLKGEPWAWSKGIRFGNSPVTVKVNDAFYMWLVAADEFNSKAAKSNPAYIRFEPVAVPHKKRDGDTYKYADKYTFKGYDVEWAYCPFDTAKEAEEFSSALILSHFFVKTPTLFSEGKERNLDHARSSAVWPEATDEQLCLPKEELTALLKARLPALLKAFRDDMEAAGFLWEQTPDKDPK
jgi:hypothetical protein